MNEEQTELHCMHVALRCFQLQMAGADDAAVQAEAELCEDPAERVYGLLAVVKVARQLITQAAPGMAGAFRSMILDQVGSFAGSIGYESLLPDLATDADRFDESRRLVGLMCDLIELRQSVEPIEEWFDDDLVRAWRGGYLLAAASIEVLAEVFEQSGDQIVARLLDTLPPDPG